jgi:predicted dehydrogenase
VKVPHHFELVTRAIEAGKHVYCEWPLGNGLTEARALADLARTNGVPGVAGTQARVAPEVEYLRQLVADGFVGEVLSTTLIGSGGAWGPEIDQANAYVLDWANGATMLPIPFGHTMAAVHDVLGEITELSARLANRRKSARVVETGETLPITAPDQVLVEGLLASGAPISIHYRGGQPRGTGLLWEINGSDGDIQVTGANGHAQLVQLSLKGTHGDDKDLRPLDIPEAYTSGWPEHVVPGNVARVYARMAADLRDGTRTAPSFDDAVGLHTLIAAVEEAADSGGRVRLSTL